MGFTAMPVLAEKPFMNSGSWYTDQLSQFTGPLPWATARRAAAPAPATPPASAAVPRRNCRRDSDPIGLSAMCRLLGDGGPRSPAPLPPDGAGRAPPQHELPEEQPPEQHERRHHD